MKKQDKITREFSIVLAVLVVLFIIFMTCVLYIMMIETDKRQTLIQDDVMKIHCDRK
jgi:hypothetical protein